MSTRSPCKSWETLCALALPLLQLKPVRLAPLDALTWAFYQVQLVCVAGVRAVVRQTQMIDLAVDENHIACFAWKRDEASSFAGCCLGSAWRKLALPWNCWLVQVLEYHHRSVCLALVEVVGVSAEAPSQTLLVATRSSPNAPVVECGILECQPQP